MLHKFKMALHDRLWRIEGGKFEFENGESLKQEISKTGNFYNGESLRRVISTGPLKKKLKSVWS